MSRKGVVEGADLEATLIPTPHLEISGFYTFLNPYFTSNTIDGVDYSHTPLAEVVKHKALRDRALSTGIT